MSNPLYNVLRGANVSANDNGFSQMMSQVEQFKQSFRGDPRAEVQKLLNSGAMTQEQFNRYAQMANQIMNLMK